MRQFWDNCKKPHWLPLQRCAVPFFRHHCVVDVTCCCGDLYPLRFVGFQDLRLVRSRSLLLVEESTLSWCWHLNVMQAVWTIRWMCWCCHCKLHIALNQFGSRLPQRICMCANATYSFDHFDRLSTRATSSYLITQSRPTRLQFQDVVCRYE